MDLAVETYGTYGLTRRGFLAGTGGVFAAACAPAASPGQQGEPTGLAGRAAWEGEWNQLVAAAKREGKLVIQTRAETGYRKALQGL